MNRQLIDQYLAGGSKLFEAYRGLEHAQLHQFPIPNSWSLHQIAVHLMDSDMIASDRMKRVACMDKPLLIGYDETAFSQLPGTEDIDTWSAIDLFAQNRQVTAKILTRLSDQAFQRYGIHSEKGKVTLQELVQSYIDHLDGHLEWVLRKRALLGCP